MGARWSTVIATGLAIAVGVGVIGAVPATAGGSQSRALTANEEGGASDSTPIVPKGALRPSYLNLYIVPGTARGGQVTARAVLWDRSTWQPISGAAIEIASGSGVTANTDANGVAEARVPLAGDRLVHGTFVSTAAYDGSSDKEEVPLTARPPADVVFLIDESGSMGGYQQSVRQNTMMIAEQLRDAVDYQIGLVGFGGGDEMLPHTHLPAVANMQDFGAAMGELGIAGSVEPGIDAIVHSVSPEMGLRPEAAKCVVLIGDEATQRANNTVADAKAALTANNAALFSVISMGGTAEYQDLARNSGGAVFDINDFGRNPQPVLEALLSTCVRSVVERPDLVVTVDDHRTEVAIGEDSTYTVGVDNAGVNPAQGSRITATLPSGLTFIGASDGGTATGQTVEWPEVTMSPGEHLERTIQVRVDGPYALGDEIIVPADARDDGANGADLTPANNTAVDTTLTVERILPLQPIEDNHAQPHALQAPPAPAQTALANTGSEVSDGLAPAALILLALGSVLVIAVRRRTRNV